MDGTATQRRQLVHGQIMRRASEAVNRQSSRPRTCRDGATPLVKSPLAGVHATAVGAGSAAEAAPDPIPSRAGAERQAAGTGAAVGATRWRSKSPRRGRQRLRGRYDSGPTAPNRLGTAAQARLGCDMTRGQVSLRRSFAFDIGMRHCPDCGAGALKIIAAILERPVIEKILTHLGLGPQPPPRSEARGPVRHQAG
jgi:hypothetical protein